MDLISGIAAVNNALGIAKTLREVEKSYDAAGYKAKIADLMDALTDAKISLGDAKEAASAKDAEISRLKASFRVTGDLVTFNGFKYAPKASDTTEPAGPPYCPRCETVDATLVRMSPLQLGRGNSCPQCKSIYTDARTFGYESRPTT